MSLPWLGLRQCDAEWPRSASEKNPTRFRSSDRIDGLGRGKINPSQPKLIQIKWLGFAWFNSSESGLINGLQPIPNKKFCSLHSPRARAAPALCATPRPEARARHDSASAFLAFSEFGTYHTAFSATPKENAVKLFGLGEITGKRWRRLCGAVSSRSPQPRSQLACASPLRPGDRHWAKHGDRVPNPIVVPELQRVGWTRSEHASDFAGSVRVFRRSACACAVAEPIGNVRIGGLATRPRRLQIV